MISRVGDHSFNFAFLGRSLCLRLCLRNVSAKSESQRFTSGFSDLALLSQRAAGMQVWTVQPLTKSLLKPEHASEGEPTTCPKHHASRRFSGGCQALARVPAAHSPSHGVSSCQGCGESRRGQSPGGQQLVGSAEPPGRRLCLRRGPWRTRCSSSLSWLPLPLGAALQCGCL